jgi:hypothetical protein
MFDWFDMPLWELRIYAAAYKKVMRERILAASSSVALGTGSLERSDRDRLLRELDSDSADTISTREFASVAGALGVFGVSYEQRRR